MAQSDWLQASQAWLNAAAIWSKTGDAQAAAIDYESSYVDAAKVGT